MLRYAILLFPLVTFFSLISFHLVLLLLTPARSCARSLASEIKQPIGRRYAEVGSASLLIPPLEWITKWKWPQGSQVHPDQLTAPSLSLAGCLKPSLFLKVLNPHQVPKTLIYSLPASGCLNPPAVVVSILESFSSTAVHNVHSGETAFLCAEIKPQDLFFMLKGHSRDLLLDSIKLGTSKRQILKRKVKSEAAESKIFWLSVTILSQDLKRHTFPMMQLDSVFH